MQTKYKAVFSLKSKKSQAGVLLIEVMIAVLIFSFGLLGLAGLQAVATQNSTNAEERIRASMLANDMVSTMWIKRSLNPTSDITAWQTLVTNSLPNATGTVTSASNVATITVTWKSHSKKSADNSNQYVTNVAIP